MDRVRGMSRGRFMGGVGNGVGLWVGVGVCKV